MYTRVISSTTPQRVSHLAGKYKLEHVKKCSSANGYVTHHHSAMMWALRELNCHTALCSGTRMETFHTARVTFWFSLGVKKSTFNDLLLYAPAVSLGFLKSTPLDPQSAVKKRLYGPV